MIRSFRCDDTRALFETGKHRRFSNIAAVADQFRLCFRWSDAGAEQVEIVDYH